MIENEDALLAEMERADNKVFDERREVYNALTLNLIGNILANNPSLRIAQVMQDTSPFEEPWDTYARLLFYGEDTYEEDVPRHMLGSTLCE